jgi:hypothetical protein
MRSGIPPEEERFLKNTIELIKAVHHGVKNLYDKGYKVIDPKTIELAICVISSKNFDKHYLITKFIEKSHQECWTKIKQRDEHYFINNAHRIFEDLPAASSFVDMFKDLYLTTDKNGKGIIDDSLKDDIWNLFDAMIKISIRYVHKNRDNNNLFDAVDLQNHVNTWQIKL